MGEVVRLEEPEQLAFEGVDITDCVLVVHTRPQPTDPIVPGSRLAVRVEGVVEVTVDTRTRRRVHHLWADWVEVME